MSDKPSAGMWGVLGSYGFPVVEITKVTEQCFWHRGGKHRGDQEVRTWLEKLVCWSADRAAADLASARLTSAESERDRRLREARIWFEREKTKIKAKVTQGDSNVPA